MSDADKAAAETRVRNERRQVLYQRLLADKDFKEFIMDEWWGGLMTEVTNTLRTTVEPTDIKSARDCWKLVEELTQHMKNTVDIYRNAEAARVEDEKRRAANVKEGKPPEAFDE